MSVVLPSLYLAHCYDGHVAASASRVKDALALQLPRLSECIHKKRA